MLSPKLTSLGVSNFSRLISRSMYVRDLDMDVVNDMTKMGELFETKGISSVQIINGIEFKNVDLAPCAPLIENDIKFNRSKNICRFKGQ